MAFNPTFVKAEAEWCAALSAYAYLEENSKNKVTIATAISNALLKAGDTWELIWLDLSLIDKGNLMYMVANKKVPGQYAIAHRGTDWKFLSNIIEDLAVFTQDVYPYAQPLNQQIKISHGALIGLQILQNMHSPVTGISAPPDIQSNVSILNLIKSLVLTSDNETDLDIMITGHSLGGALATIFSAWLIDSCKQWKLRPDKINFKTYTIAAPTVGNMAFCNYYNSACNQNTIKFSSYRIHNLQDLVPHAFDNLLGLLNCGVPLDAIFSDVLKVSVQGVNGIFELKGINYAAVGTDMPLNNAGANSGCVGLVKNLDEYGCWVSYEHSINTYQTLISAMATT